jgi:uncharacterized protein YdcH (DUF465 family)
MAPLPAGLGCLGSFNYCLPQPIGGNCYDYVNASFNQEGTMTMTADDIRQSLLATDPEFRRLAEEHSRCESQLKQVLEESYHNAEDFELETTLKKMKLHLRDRMEMIVARHQHHLVPH